MRRFTAITAGALVLAFPVHGFAKGGAGFGRSNSDFVNIVPALPEPEVSPHSILGGCGRRHHCDPGMHKPHGPADMEK